jgi:hypothetical protein
MTDLIEPLNTWLVVVRNEDIDSDNLVAATTNLVEALKEMMTATGEYPNRHLHPQFSEAHHIIRNLIGLSGQFLWNVYTDSDTDAPCDLEWDVHHLQKAIDDSYTIPDDVEPAYVMGTVYPTPDDEDEDEPEHHAH